MQYTNKNLRKNDIRIFLQAAGVCILFYLVLFNMFYLVKETQENSRTENRKILMYNFSDNKYGINRMRKILLMGNPTFFAKANLDIGYSSVLRETDIEFNIDTKTKEFIPWEWGKLSYINKNIDDNCFVSEGMDSESIWQSSEQRNILYKIFCKDFFSPLLPPSPPFIRRSKPPSEFPLWIDGNGKILPQLFDNPEEIISKVFRKSSTSRKGDISSSAVNGKRSAITNYVKKQDEKVKFFIKYDTEIAMEFNDGPFFPDCKIVRSSGQRILDMEALKACQKNWRKIKNSISGKRCKIIVKWHQ